MKSKLKYIYSILLIAVSGILTCAIQGCADDSLDTPVPEGEETLISLQVKLPKMQQYTRADMSQNIKNRVNNLWVAIYNANSGERTYVGYKEYSNLVPGDHELQDWEEIRTKSGRSFIVAVANSLGQEAIDVTSDEVKDMKTLLDAADTWTKFRSLAVKHLEGNVYVPNPSVNTGLVMSGCYYEKSNSDPESWEGLGAVEIPVNKTAKPITLDGAIHLRRPYSQVKFEILPDQNVVDLTVKSYQVMNVPEYSWVYERRQQDASASNILGYANAGDAVTPDFSANKNYPASLTFTSANMRVEQIGDVGNNYLKYSFDFWMPENKRTGLESCKLYTDRQREFTTTITDAPEDDPNTPYLRNSGIYRSLCPTEAGGLNNNATYVLLDCDVKYKDLQDGAIRNGHTQYVVHLGYIKEDPRDFNTYRNSIYTYKIKISGLNNILVEASREGDTQPSAEGIVSDATDANMELDAHYNVFNVSFSEADLEKYNFVMETYNYGQRYAYESGNIPSRESAEWKYYDWVQLVKLNDNPNGAESTTIAAYPGKDSNKIIHLDDIKNAGAGTFTVFVNEYTYENSANETGGNWKGYVKQSPRKFWMRVQQKTSPDGESSYYTSKYAISQRSIQTYYNPADNTVKTALGLEHENENFGMNVRWKGNSSSSYDNNNGRKNCWDALSTTKSWTTYITPTKQQSINRITNTNQQYFGNKAARNVSVPQVALTTVSGNTIATGVARTYDPQISGTNIQYYNAMIGCLNRNRDEDGDGVISQSEMKWYLPASGQMLRTIIGEKNLSTPLIDYSKGTLPFTCGEGQNSLYHYATSDAKFIWTEEGTSSTEFTLTADWYKGAAAWQVRCIRNLGIDQSSVNNTTETAYTTELYSGTGATAYYSSGVVKVPYYYGAAVRDNALDPIPMHKIQQDYNKLGRYGFEIAPKGNTTERYNGQNPNEMSAGTYRSSWSEYNKSIDNASPCSNLEGQTGRTGWRIPNQRELAIMMRMGAISGGTFMGCTQEYWSSSAPAVGSFDIGQAYRICGVDAANRIGLAYMFGDTNYVRCVRDLTAEEEKMTYSEILKHKTAKLKRESAGKSLTPQRVSASGARKAATAGAVIL